jgi:hypothetical protein
MPRLKDFYSCKRWIRKNFKTKKRFRIGLVTHDTIVKHRKHYQDTDDGEYEGYCAAWVDTDDKMFFQILIDKELSDDRRIEVLLHEFAHVLQFSHRDTKGHDEVYQKYYKRIVRKWNSVS